MEPLMKEIINNYQWKTGRPDYLTIGVLGSHSALDVAKGGSDEGLDTLVVCKKGRENVYEFHKKRQRGHHHVGCINDVMALENWSDIASKENIEKMIKSHTILVPHRSMEVYLGYDIIEKQLRVPIFGNRHLLRAEERTGPYKIEKNQDYLVRVAGLPSPRKFSSPDEIDVPVIVKATKAIGDRSFERRFPIVSSKEEYESACQKLVSQGRTDAEKKAIEKNFKSATIEEYIEGNNTVNLNFFYSPLHNNDKPYGGLELMGCDTRKQFPNGEEFLHIPVSLRESLMQKAYDMGMKFVETARKEMPPGIIGPFALQTIGDKNEKMLVYDVSLRIPGSPDTEVTPYTGYFHREPISFGRRIAMEIKEAFTEHKLSYILT